MAESEFVLRVERLDHEFLVLDGLALAGAFFAGDPSSADDSLSGLGNAERIELEDVIAMNRTMRARSPHKVWTAIVEGEAPWLGRVPANLDLLELDDEDWHAAGGDELVSAALAATIGPGRGLAVATKLLHLKRPRLFPMLDRFVAEMLGLGAVDDPVSQRRVEAAVRLTRAIRTEGRRNLTALYGIRDALALEGIRRPLVRIFDAIVWSSHPAAGVSGSRRMIDVRLHTD
jgi:hypothetical protein